MSEDKDKEQRIHANEESGEEVEAHVKSRQALDEGGADEGKDEVEAHVKLKRSDDDDGDDVQAHVKAYKS